MVAVCAADVPRSHRERLVRHGFLLRGMKGWYVAGAPDRPAGDGSAWYPSFWRFCAAYLRPLRRRVVPLAGAVHGAPRR